MYKIEQWVINNIEYKLDRENYGMLEYWALPSLTLARGTGDCEDGAFLIMSLGLNAGVDPNRLRFYAGKVKAYDYYTDEPMSVNQVKEIEKQAESDGAEIAKVQFLEDWFFDPVTFNFYKKVHFIMLAYEILDENGNVRNYKAAFYVPFGIEKEGY